MPPCINEDIINQIQRYHEEMLYIIYGKIENSAINCLVYVWGRGLKSLHVNKTFLIFILKSILVDIFK